MTDHPRLVVDASVLVDLFAGTEYANSARARLSGAVIHAPAHLDAEVLSALGRLERGGRVAADDVARALTLLAAIPMTRHPLPDLLVGAWKRRAPIRLVDGLYVELAERLEAPLVTTDRRLARTVPGAQLLQPDL